MFERRGQPGPASDAMLACAVRIWHRGHVEESSSLAERARAIAERGGDPERNVSVNLVRALGGGWSRDELPTL